MDDYGAPPQGDVSVELQELRQTVDELRRTVKRMASGRRHERRSPGADAERRQGGSPSRRWQQSLEGERRAAPRSALVHA